MLLKYFFFFHLQVCSTFNVIIFDNPLLTYFLIRQPDLATLAKLLNSLKEMKKEKSISSNTLNRLANKLTI